MEKNEVKEAIFASLVEPPGQLDREIIERCKGLVKLEVETRQVRVADVRVTDKDRVVLYCLGRRLMSYLLDDPSLADVAREELERDLGVEGKAISAYASVLIDHDRLLERGSRGLYRVKLHSISGFLTKVRQKAGL